MDQQSVNKNYISSDDRDIIGSDQSTSISWDWNIVNLVRINIQIRINTG